MSAATAPVRVLIADEHGATRAGVRMSLNADEFEVVAEVSTAAEAVEAAVRERPDICLLDVGIPGGAFGAVAAISARVPDIAVVMLGSDRDDDSVFAALR